MKNHWLVAAFAVSLSACGNMGGGDGGEGVAAVQPSLVTAAELRRSVSDPLLVRFYEARDWQPAWTADTARNLVEAIGGAAAHALDPRAFLARVEAADAPVAREAALSQAALAYARALALGMVDPKRVHAVYELPRPEVDLVAGLAAALESGGIGDWYSSLVPQDEEYRMLSQAYVAAVRQARTERPVPIARGEEIRPGASDPRIPAIRAALAASGYAPAAEEKSDRSASNAPSAEGAIHDPDLVRAVRLLQQDHGMEATGRIDDDLVALLDGSAGFERARKLAVNLERRRWLPRETVPTRIDVNIADAFLTFWRDGAVADRRRTVAGQPGNETPQMQSPMFRLVAHPTWTVPKSIEAEEIAPKGEAYLQRNNMIRRDGYVVQMPGPTNSLGQVKFDMKNDHAIYLHDTPAKSLFASDDRHRSHGCVRVHDALGFARMIAEQEGIAPQWQRAFAAQDETFVALPREIPVRLFYHTAFADGGRVRFRDDPYGWDEDVADALGLSSRPRRERGPHVGDIGP